MPDQEKNGVRINPVMRLPVPWVFMLAYLIGFVVQLYLPIPIRSPEIVRAVLIAGLILVVIGVAVAFSALGIFRKRSTTTIPFETPTSLVTSGPYRFTRNPMYVGLTLVYLGVAGTRAEIWPVIVLPVMLAYINFIVIPVEERHLQDAFGDAYANYGARVRRWL
ncbi:MAG TPA: isoprenylcysteine carboxylmethyltransferase family protein [Gemmatimonadaceae bacterium]